MRPEEFGCINGFAEHLAEVDKERAEVQQFVYSAKEAPSAAMTQRAKTP